MAKFRALRVKEVKLREEGEFESASKVSHTWA